MFNARELAGYFTLLIVISSGCATTTQRWGEWQEGAWLDTGKANVSRIALATEPDHAKVVLDGRVIGQTPLTISLPYTVETRADNRIRYEDRTTVAGETKSAILGLLSLGGQNASPKARTRPIDHESRSMTRTVSRAYDISVQKPGYFPRSFQITSPSTEGDKLSITLSPQQAMVVGPVAVVEGVTREAGFFTWLKSFLVSRYGIPASQYEAISERVTSAVQAQLSETGLFTSVTASTSDSADVSTARLSIEIQLLEGNVVIQGTLSSPDVLGTSAITRQVQTPTAEFLKNIFNASGQLTKQLIGPYSSAVSVETSNVGNHSEG